MNYKQAIKQQLKDTSWIDNLPEEVKQDILRRRATRFHPDNLTYKQKLKRDKTRKKLSSIKDR